eukprot:1160449-Pelagomonas_calceolata.AAC.10
MITLQPHRQAPDKVLVHHNLKKERKGKDYRVEMKVKVHMLMCLQQQYRRNGVILPSIAVSRTFH